MESTLIRANQIEGLREMILEILAEVEERRVPRELLIDVEALRRSPAGALIRMENQIQHLIEGQEALGKALDALRAEMREGQEALRAEFRRDLANLERLMEARFAAIEVRLDALEHRIARTDFWVKFFAGLVSALFVAQLALTFIR